MESLSGFDTNKVTLMYLAKGAYAEEMSRTDTERSKQLKKDAKFYRKRVFAQMKDMLRGEFKNDRLRGLHNEYVHTIIQCLKEEDRAEILQKDYPPQTGEQVPAFDGVANLPDNATVEEANACLMRQTIEPMPTLDDYVHVKRVEVEPASFPRLREVNIRTEAHRSKGVKPGKSKRKKKDSTESKKGD